MSGIIISSINSARHKARVAKVVSDLRTIEMAFNMLYLETGCWPKERDTQESTHCHVGLTASTSNPYISQAVESNTSNLKEYLPNAPVFPLASIGTGYYYDNDLDTRNMNTCATNTNTQNNRGVNIYVDPSSESFIDLFNALNDILDKNEIGDSDTVKQRCGKISLTDTGSLRYYLSLKP